MGDQHSISTYSCTAQSIIKVMRKKKMIYKRQWVLNRYREVWCQIIMVAKILDLNNFSWQRRLISLSNDGRKVWASNLSLSAILHRKFKTIFMFFPVIFARQRFFSFSVFSNFAPIATWRNDFFLLFTSVSQEMYEEQCGENPWWY